MTDEVAPSFALLASRKLENICTTSGMTILLQRIAEGG